MSKNILGKQLRQGDKGQPAIRQGTSGQGRKENQANPGIGTTSPEAKLNIYGDSTRIQMNSSTAGGQTGIKFGTPNGNITSEILIDTANFAFRNTQTGSLTTKMYISGETGNVGIGTTGPNSTLQVNGNIVGTTKNFQIPHPLGTYNWLTHSTIEGPEIAVYYRGEGRLANGTAVVQLPAYFEALTRKENRSVILTPKFDNNELISAIAASSVTNGTFRVRAIDNSNPNQKFNWEVKAVRADVPVLVVEKD